MNKNKKSKQSLRNAYALLRPHAKPVAPLIILVMALGAVSAAATAGVIALINPIFSLVLVSGEISEPAAAPDLLDPASHLGLGQEGAMDNGYVVAGEWLHSTLGWEWLGEQRLAVLVVVLLVLSLLTVLASISQYAFNQSSNFVSLRMIVGLRLRVTRHLMGLGLHYHGQRKLGDLLSRISADMQMTLTAVMIWFRDLVQNGMLAVFYLLTAAYYQPMLTGIMVISLPLLAVPVTILSKKVRKRSTKSLTSLGASVQVLSQMFLGIRTVKAFRAEDKELERYGELNEEYLKDSMRMVRAKSQTMAWTILSTQMGLGLLFVIVGVGGVHYGWFSDEEALASLMTFFLANAQAYTHIKRFTRSITRIEESVGASERLQELLDEKPDIEESASPTQLNTFEDGIGFRDVTFAYPETEVSAIQGLNLEVKRGETLAIVGSSGSGKSTLMGLVCRFFDPTGGAIEVDGHDLRSLSLDSWMGLFSMVDQAPFLFHTSIAENLRYAKKDATEEQLFDACRAAQIHDFIMELPDGYDTNVADAGARLSGGQRQRITIARALLKGAPILLLDEATSSLDTESERGVQEALDTLMAGRTVIVIAHRLSTIQNADRIAVLENGRLAELGTHAELQAKGGAYARALELQSVS